MNLFNFNNKTIYYNNNNQPFDVPSPSVLPPKPLNINPIKSLSVRLKTVQIISCKLLSFADSAQRIYSSK